MRRPAICLLLLLGAVASADPSEPVQELVATAARIFGEDPGNVDRAVDLLARAERRDPRSPGLWFTWAEISFGAERYQDAAVGYETAMRRGFRTPDARAMLARSLLALGVRLYKSRRDRKPRVLEILERANNLVQELAEDPKQPPDRRRAFRELGVSARMNLAAARQWIGDFAEAARIFEELAREYPKSYIHWMNLARAYTATMRWEDAIRAVERAKALKGDPDWLEAHMILGLAHSHLGHTALAERHLALYLAERPDDVSVLSQLAEHYIRGKQFGAAAEILRRVVELDPDRLRAHQKLAFALRHLGLVEEARRHEEIYRRLDEARKARRARGAGMDDD